MTSAVSRAFGAEVRKVLEKHPDVHLAILFGSVARGEERPESDLDLAVDRGRPLSADEKMELISALAIATGRSVDLIDLHTIGEPLLGQVLKDGILLVGDRADDARLISKHVFEATDFLPYRQRILIEGAAGAMDREVKAQKLESLRRCLLRIESKRPDSPADLSEDSDLQDIITGSQASDTTTDLVCRYSSSPSGPVSRP